MPSTRTRQVLMSAAVALIAILFLLIAGGIVRFVAAVHGVSAVQRESLVQILAWAVLLLPLAGFVVLAAFGSWIKHDREELGAGLLACGVVVAACALSIWATLVFAEMDREFTTTREQHAAYFQTWKITPAQLDANLAVIGRAFQLTPYLRSHGTVSPSVDWIRVGVLRVPFALVLDRLSLLMMLVVTGVGALIHIYSLGYMARDPERVRYFSYMNLFTFFMLLLVMAGNLPLMFVGWEGVGLCSYLLIGFWFKRPAAAAAGQKAFLLNRIGDAALILGIVLAFHVLGALDLVRNSDVPNSLTSSSIAEQLAAKQAEPVGAVGPLTLIALLLFAGACGKSAQIPLHVWLPDAMEGPTPVSALIHAATMVTAGVYLLARLSLLYAHAPTALAVVAVVGVATAFMAGTIALVQTDVKRVLAYSTVSQLGFMFLACGVGAFGAAIFHVFTHAFFKALLFLGAGAVMHALAGEQDVRRMGGLRGRLPWTFWTFTVGAAAIAGVPFLSGYMSKEEILAGTLAAGHPWLLVVALAAAALTAFYMTRLVSLTFFGAFRGSEEARGHLHEAPWTMRVPLVLLALGALGAGYVAVPRMLAPVVAPQSPGAHAAWLPELAIVLALAAIVAAAYLYLEFVEVVARLRSRLALAARVLEAKWGFDLAYDWFARRVVLDGTSSLLWRRLDLGLIDAAVDGTARVVAGIAARTRTAQTGLVRQYALVLFGASVLLLAYLVWQ